MFISRTPWNKQPSLSLSVLPTQGLASAGYKNPSVSRWGSIIVAKAHGLKDSYSALSLFALLLALFIHHICTRCSKETLHHLSYAGFSALQLKNLSARKVTGSQYIFPSGVSEALNQGDFSCGIAGQWKYIHLTSITSYITCQHLQRNYLIRLLCERD